MKAVDKYTAGLSVLMPLLQKEPKGRRLVFSIKPKNWLKFQPFFLIGGDH